MAIDYIPLVHYLPMYHHSAMSIHLFTKAVLPKQAEKQNQSKNWLNFKRGSQLSLFPPNAPFVLGGMLPS